MTNTLTFATRPSALARWQTRHIAQMLRRAWPELTTEEVVITTRGDRELNRPLPEIGGKGLFTQELEAALRRGEVHVAVHSLKDLPVDDAPGLTVGCIPARADVHDVLVCPEGHTLEKLPTGAVVGSSSLRRQAQLLAARPDLQIRSIRGNVETRIRKAQQGAYDALVLAAAGLSRLGLEAHITQVLPLEVVLPAPGQGALAVQCRADDEHTLALLRPLADESTRRAVTAERAFLRALGGGCSLPVGAYATSQGAALTLRVVVAAPDGSQVIRLQGSGSDPAELGQSLAREALSRGAESLLPH